MKKIFDLLDEMESTILRLTLPDEALELWYYDVMPQVWRITNPAEEPVDEVKAVLFVHELRKRLPMLELISKDLTRTRAALEDLIDKYYAVRRDARDGNNA